MTQHRIWFATAMSWFALAPAAALAEGMQVEPGQWEFTATTDMPMLPGPKTVTTTRCITEPEVDPDAFMDQARECTVTEVESDATSMRWKMTCANPGGTMTSEASYTSTGTAVNGTMTMNIDVDGQTITMSSTTAGKRLGPCD